MHYVYANGSAPTDMGVYGVQAYYNNLLSGVPGHTTLRYDTRGEPGSTFKAITVAIGFDLGLFDENTKVYDSGDLFTHGSHIHDWCWQLGCTFGGQETPAYMLHYSSNIGATLFSQRISSPQWYEYVEQNFAFGRPSGVDLAGEIGGSVVDGNAVNPPWAPIDKDTQAYGQGISVTPLQLANAYAALTNGGILPTPHVLQTYTLAGKTVTPAWNPIRRAVSQQTSDRMKALLVKQAVGGEACRALVPGYDIAAKTGTASIPSLGGNYLPDTTIASTAAFGPLSEDLSHQFVVLVKVDKPNDPWGSDVAAPVVGDIYQQLFSYYDIPPAQHPVQPSAGVCPQASSALLVTPTPASGR